MQQQRAPLLSFQLGAVVGDVAWAPYSSTVFAAVTDEGRVHVYDLAQNRQLPLCAQKVTRRWRRSEVAQQLSAHTPWLLTSGRPHACACYAAAAAPQCAKKARLTRVAFNPRHPVLLVGDSKGGVAALKLSPNLRRCCVRPDAGSGASSSSSAKPAPSKEALERAKLGEVIRVARKSQAPVPAAEAAAL